jgi:hypothetical protein
MNKLILLALAAGTAVATIPVANAREGCGPGFHRGPAGHCRPNGGYDRGPAVVGGPGVRLVIGNYYHGRGYWDGRRYYQNRYRHGGGWRYR